MKSFYRTLIAIASIAASFSGNAQQAIPIPASSVGGSGWATIAIRIPSESTISNIAYNAVVPYIPTSAAIANIAYSTVMPLIPSPTVINNYYPVIGGGGGGGTYMCGGGLYQNQLRAGPWDCMENGGS